MTEDNTEPRSVVPSHIEEQHYTIKRENEEYWKDPTGIKLIKAPCGSGKSTISQTILKEHEIRNFITLVPNHNNADQIIKENWCDENQLWKPIHLKGKPHTCIRINEDEVKDLREEMNGAIPQWFCEMCPNYMNECAYHSKLEAVKRGAGCVGVHSQLDSSLQSVIQDEDRPLILDENIVNALIHTDKVPINRINRLLPSLIGFPVLNRICNLLLDKKNDGNNSDEELLSELRNTHFSQEWNARYRYFRELKNNDYDSRLTGLIVLSFVSNLQRFAKENPEATEVLFFDNSGDLCAETYSKIPRRNNCIVMSATMDLEITKKFFPSDAEFPNPLVIQSPLASNVLLYQLGGEERIFEKEGKEPRSYWTNSLPLTSLIKDKKPTKILKNYAFIIKQICPQYQNVLIVCHKKVRSYIEKQIRLPNVSTEHYGAVEGLNTYNHYDCEILLGTPFLPDDVIKRRSRKLGIDFDILMDNSIKEHMIQAYERIRPRNTSKFRTIIVLSSYPIFDNDTPIRLTKSELLDRFKCISLKDRIKQKDLVYSLCMNDNSMDLTALRNSVTGDNNRKKKLISYLKDEGIFISSNTRVPPKNREKELISIPQDCYKQITEFSSSVKVRIIENPHIVEFFNQICESDPPDYPQSYYDDLYKGRLSDVLPLTISELMGCSAF
ncbi:MAG: hypothetical protein JW870_16765 [Candidatus Delongbacteria bacterium]|nr:hypothetical protein [Candidatus Delongbacteria bacterium]